MLITLFIYLQSGLSQQWGFEMASGLRLEQSFDGLLRTNRTIIDGITYATEEDETQFLILIDEDIAYFPGEGMVLDDGFRIPKRTSKVKAQQMIRDRVAELKASGVISEEKRDKTLGKAFPSFESYKDSSSLPTSMEMDSMKCRCFSHRHI